MISMTENFTKNELLTAIYDETDNCTQYKMKQSLLEDKELGAEYRLLKSTISILENNLLEPKASTVKNILQYSKQKENSEVVSF
jgi:predicted transcriptional regulator